MAEICDAAHSSNVGQNRSAVNFFSVFLVCWTFFRALVLCAILCTRLHRNKRARNKITNSNIDIYSFFSVFFVVSSFAVHSIEIAMSTTKIFNFISMKLWRVKVASQCLIGWEVEDKKASRRANCVIFHFRFLLIELWPFSLLTIFDVYDGSEWQKKRQTNISEQWA